MPFSDRAVLKVKKFFLVLSGGPPCGFNHTYLDSGLRVTQAMQEVSARCSCSAESFLSFFRDTARPISEPHREDVPLG